jgi:hypothetical protein
MYRSKLHKRQQNRIYNILIRLLIIGLTYGFIIRQIFYQKKIDDILTAFSGLIDRPYLFVFLIWVTFLMLVNWGIESLKWQFLISKVEKVPLLKSFMAVLSGVSVSSVTPNRVGEYFGRVFILERANPWKGIFITIIGSMSQLLMTIIMGSLSLLIYLPVYHAQSDFYSEYLYYALVLLVLCIVIALILIFLNVSGLPGLISRFVRKRLARIYEYFTVISYYSTFELAIVLLYSFLRYCVFAIQFYLLLLMFSVDIPFFHGIIMITIIFFVLTAIPSVTLAEIGIRGSVSLFFIGTYFEKFETLTPGINIGILAASSSIWLINLALPAFIGTFFVFRLKFFKKRPKNN